MTADSENPYASPREPSQGAAEPVGLWRDGPYVVAHRHATFPAFCVRTNESARRAFRCRLTWSYPIDISSRTVVFDVGLCEACLHRHFRARWIGWAAGVFGLGSAALSLLLADAGGISWSWFFIITLVAGFSGFALASRPGVRLTVKHVRKPYFWLRGAHPGFVDRLPPWPGP